MLVSVPERTAPGQSPEFDVMRVRDNFPILNQLVHGKQLVYLDNAATTQKPNTVLCSLNQFYGCCNSNIHEGCNSTVSWHAAV